MILTCPSCGTRYVVKDGAIPPAGRTVRCAQCKHSWHQDPDDAPIDGEPGGAPEPVAAPYDQPNDGGDAAVDDRFADADYAAGPAGADRYPTNAETVPSADMLAEPDTAATMPEEAAAASEPYPETAVPFDEQAPGVSDESAYPAEPARVSHPLRAARMEAEDVYSPFADEGDDEQPRRRWPLILGLLVLLVALVAAGVYFLAPTELKSRLGIAQGDTATQLTVQVQQHGRTQLASGNQLFEVSGTVRNETEEALPVPPLNAQLRSLDQQVVYRWTIPISPPQLAPGATASFNSANLDVPASAACLEVFFGQQRAAPRCRDEQAVGA